MDNSTGPIVVLLIAVAWFAWRSVKPKRPASKDASSATRDVAPKVAARPPAHWIARWHVRYLDFNGETTERIVRVVSVQPRLEKLHVWCELRNAERTFNLTGLTRVTDAETGEFIDMRDWLQSYSQSRRKPKTAS